MDLHAHDDALWTTQKRTVPLEDAVAGAIKRGLIKPALTLDEYPCGYFYDIGAYKRNMAALRSAFPSHWHHATAVKSNPLSAMLQLALQNGHGAECASIGEVLHAQKLGFKGTDIVFDSPCKSIPEIKHTLQNKIMLNMDNLQELKRVRQIVQTMSPDELDGCVIGLRINPLVGSGSVANLSVSTRKSKFGVVCPSTDTESTERAQVVEVLVEHHFVNAVHVHTGSGGMTLDQMANGAAAAARLAMEVNARRPADAPRIDVIDIGGGLPVAWGKPTADPLFEAYSDAIRIQCPELFDGRSFRRVVTEMGSSMNSRFGFFGSVCEYTKPVGEGQIAMIHCGSDQFMRASYAPHMREQFPVAVFNSTGELKQGDPIPHDIAGPLCFAGDIVAQTMAPRIEPGDVVVLAEVGSNCHSLRTAHCSRRTPPMFGYEVGDGDDRVQDGIRFFVLSNGTGYDDVLKMWGSVSDAGSADESPPLPPFLADIPTVDEQMQALRAAVTDVIDKQKVGMEVSPEVPFENYGLKSIDVMTIAANLSILTGLKVAPVDVLEHPTVAALSDHLARALRVL